VFVNEWAFAAARRQAFVAALMEFAVVLRVPGRTGVGGRNGSVDSCGGRLAARKSPARPASWSDFRRCAIFPLPLFLRACPSPLVPWPASLLAALEGCMSEMKPPGAIEMNRDPCGEFARRMTPESPIQNRDN
jgi:hypothetical protein